MVSLYVSVKTRLADVGSSPGFLPHVSMSVTPTGIPLVGVTPVSMKRVGQAHWEGVWRGTRGLNEHHILVDPGLLPPAPGPSGVH